MAHLFPTNIQQTLPLASGDDRDDRAPAVAGGDAFSNHLELATSEEANRKRLKELDPNVVSVNEIKQSRLRRIAIETTEAQITHGIGNAAILAAVEANATAIEANATAIEANATAIQEILAAVQANADATQNNVEKMQATQAMILNLRRRKKCRSGAWAPLLVERVGANAVGVPPADFPESREHILAMEGPAITALQNSFNLPAGTFAGDSLAARRAAVLDYILEGF